MAERTVRLRRISCIADYDLLDSSSISFAQNKSPGTQTVINCLSGNSRQEDKYLFLLTGAYEIGVIGFEPTASCSQSRRSSQAELHPGNSGTVIERLLPDAVSEKTYHVHHKNYSTRSMSVLQYNPARAGGLNAGESIVGATRCGGPGQVHRPARRGAATPRQAPTVGSLR